MASRFANHDSMNLYRWLRNSEYAKRERQALSEIHRRYYAGEGFYVYDRETLTVRVDNYVRRNNSVFSFASAAIDSAQATMMEVMLKPQAYAPSGDRDDLNAIAACNAFLSNHWYLNNSAKIRRNIAHDLCVQGDSVLCTRWDDKAFVRVVLDNPGQIVALGEMMREQGKREPFDVRQMADGKWSCIAQMGATSEHIVPADLLFVDSSATCWADVTTFCIVEYPDVEAARERYPIYADRIQPLYIGSDRGANSYYVTYNISDTINTMSNNQYMGTQFSPDQNRTMIAHFYNKVDGFWEYIPCTGRICETVMDKYSESGLRTTPYTKFSAKYQASFWSKSLFHDMLVPSYMVNVLMCQMCRYLAEGVKTLIMAPMGTTQGALTDEFYQIWKYDGTGNPPTVKSADSTIVTLHSNLIDRMLDYINRLGQVSDVGVGIIKSRTSGRAIQEAKESISTTILQMRENIRDAEKECAAKVLHYNQQYSILPTLLSIAGDDGTYAARAFLGSDILGGQDIQIIDTDESPRAADARVDIGLQLVAEQAMSLSQFSQFVETGKYTDITPKIVQFNEKQARYENDLIQAGRVQFLPIQMLAQDPLQSDIARVVGTPVEMQLNVLADIPTDSFGNMTGFPVPLIDKEQIHEAHLAIHREQLADPSTPVGAKTMLRFHIDEHQRIVDQRMQEEMAQAAQQLAIQTSAEQQGQKEAIQLQSEAQTQGAIQLAIVEAQLERKYGKTSPQGTQSKKGATSNPTSGGRQSGRSRAR